LIKVIILQWAAIWASIVYAFPTTTHYIKKQQ